MVFGGPNSARTPWRQTGTPRSFRSSAHSQRPASAVSGKTSFNHELGKIQEAFGREVQRSIVPCKAGDFARWSEATSITSQADGEGSRDSDSEDEASSEEGSARGSALEVHQASVRNVKLAGVATSLTGEVATPTPGYGKGVPPCANIELCAVVRRPGKEAIVVTAASDGTNIFWGQDWEQLGQVLFASVFAHFMGGRVEEETLVGIHAKAKQKLSRFDSQRTDAKGQAGRAARAKAKRAEVDQSLRREKTARDAQKRHLDPVRERFIREATHTTMLSEVHFDATKRVHDQLQHTRLLIDNIEWHDKSLPGVKYSAPKAGAGMIPNTPRALIELLKERADRGRMEKRVGQGRPALRDKTDGGQTLALPRSDGTVSSSSKQLPLQLSCIATHPELPCMVAAAANGEIAVYHLFRAHGQRRPHLHQTEGFDASGGEGDIVTALHVPLYPMAQKGALKHESFIAGFQSGRVAVFRIHPPQAPHDPGEENLADAASEAEGNLGAGVRKMVEASNFSGPALSLFKPPLLEHRLGKSTVVSVFFHATLGILSVHNDGAAIVADTAGAQTWCIHNALGPKTTIGSADLTLEGEQLAVAGNKAVTLWQCISQTQVGTLDTSEVRGASSICLVRFLPSKQFLVTVHEGDGTTLIWDAARLELHRTIWMPPLQVRMASMTTCAYWNDVEKELLIFASVGLTERRLEERTHAGAEVEEPRKTTVELPRKTTWGGSLHLSRMDL